MKSNERPYVLFVAEKIYLEVSEIKKKNPDFSNMNAIESFIGSKTYKLISKIDLLLRFTYPTQDYNYDKITGNSWTEFIK